MPIGIGQSTINAGRGKFDFRIVMSTTAEASVIIGTRMHYMMVENIGNKIIYIGGTGVSTTEYSMFLTPKENHDFGIVDSTFGFYMVCGSALASTLGVTEHA